MDFALALTIVELLLISTSMFILATLITRWLNDDYRHLQRLVDAQGLPLRHQPVDPRLVIYVRWVRIGYAFWIIAVILKIAFILTLTRLGDSLQASLIYTLALLIDLANACGFQEKHIGFANQINPDRPIPEFFPEW